MQLSTATVFHQIIPCLWQYVLLKSDLNWPFKSHWGTLAHSTIRDLCSISYIQFIQWSWFKHLVYRNWSSYGWHIRLQLWTCSWWRYRIHQLKYHFIIHTYLQLILGMHFVYKWFAWCHSTTILLQLKFNNEKFCLFFAMIKFWNLCSRIFCWACRNFL